MAPSSGGQCAHRPMSGVLVDSQHSRHIRAAGSHGIGVSTRRPARCVAAPGAELSAFKIIEYKEGAS